MRALLDVIRWKRIPISAGAAAGNIELTIGEVGAGHPVGLVAAGIHGDEGPWGAWAIRKLLETTSIDDLRGSLRLVPAANPLAMEADTRNAPLDSLDLNRTFPGNADGSHTERLAAALVSNAVEGVDIVIDLHGGGSWCVNAFAFQFEGGEDLARAFAPPFLTTGPDRNVTLTGYARSKGARVTGIEMGGKGETEGQWAEHIARGLRCALGMAGVLTPTNPPNNEPIVVRPSSVLRPSRGGVLMPRARVQDVGTVVAGGTLLGQVLDPATFDVIENFEAPFPRTALLLLRPRLTRIEGGAMTYVVAEPMS